MEQVCCQEQGAVQLDGFNLSIMSGEIMGLMLINSHGLTALINLLQRNTPLRGGYVYYREEQINSWRRSKPRNNRIGLIQSGSCLVEGLTVSDNIFVLKPDFRQQILNRSVFREQLTPFLDGIGTKISADAYIDELTEFEKIIVAILKSIAAGCKLLVLTDISANVCEAEILKIHSLLKRYAGEGISFLYADYHFEELSRVCDKVALMSGGRIIKLLQGDELTPESLNKYTLLQNGAERRRTYGFDAAAQQTVSLAAAAQQKGTHATAAARQADAPTAASNAPITASAAIPAMTGRRPLLEVRNLTGALIDGLSFSAGCGECVVLQNVDEQVFGELLSIISGAVKPRKGDVLIDGKPLAPSDMGGDLAIIQDLPTKTMLFYEMSYFDNLCFLLDRRLPEIWRDDGVREGVRREYAGTLGDAVFDARIDDLSETQKYYLVYTRVAIQKPKAVFCVQPFRRADMELRTHITGLMRMLLNNGAALVVLAENLAGSLPLADKLLRIRKDMPAEVYSRGDFRAIANISGETHGAAATQIPLSLTLA